MRTIVLELHLASYDAVVDALEGRCTSSAAAKYYNGRVWFGFLEFLIKVLHHTLSLVVY